MTDEKFPPEKNLPAGYVPPKVWTWEPGNGGQFASINRPTAGAQTDVELKVGKHPLQLYSLATPNGQKVTILLEELLAAGHTGAEYDAWLINIGKGDQFGSGFVGVNPNSKIPALADHAPVDGGKPIRLFESASIMTYLAEKFGAFLPTDPRARAETLNWLFWQMGSAPFVGGGFGHFFSYAPVKIQYAIDRYAMETKRQLDVLNRQLAETEFVAGKDYTIADMAIWPWYGRLALDQSYPDAGTFLSTHEYTHVVRWAKQLAERPALKRGVMVNKTSGPLSEQLHERHDAADFDTKTQDKLTQA
ncbi:glutathione-dependent disulfide-bond oxidoreductase [Rhizobium glycinendophyticum]|uniref:Glutathione-dependent disulfide-bond oxidoreductase n=1 Tax=Rhizobium glycinendophyticum TaxID=2589807 RepID=A0A504U812_9HYPH|nr:glutathione-dependent disulfide-bond oxidoreductase [Rhizobium glycinendophyticum]TPP06645.1 glutathione-dependent disulfide-bond oxidoreductase [Rhizobium glycinendophyticum]